MSDLSEREARLVETSRRAYRWFKNRLNGTALNGANDDIHIARRFEDILTAYGDVDDPREPPHPTRHS